MRNDLPGMCPGLILASRPGLDPVGLGFCHGKRNTRAGRSAVFSSGVLPPPPEQTFSPALGEETEGKLFQSFIRLSSGGSYL